MTCVQKQVHVHVKQVIARNVCSLVRYLNVRRVVVARTLLLIDAEPPSFKV